MSVYETSKRFGQFARKENKQVEKLVKMNPAFRRVKGELITIIGRC